MKSKLNTFKIESLLDKQGEYIGIFDAKTGLLIGHEGTLVKTNLEEQETEENDQEQENKNQLKLF
jgi:hypothetical protein